MVTSKSRWQRTAGVLFGFVGIAMLAAGLQPALCADPAPAPASAAAADAGGWKVIISPDNSLEFGVVRGQQPVLKVAMGGWGPKWSWMGLHSKQKAEGGKLVAEVPFVVNKADGQVINVKFQVAKSGPREVAFRFDLSADKDVPLTMLIAGISVNKDFAQGKLVLTHTGEAKEKETELKLPFGIAGRPATSKGVLHLDKGGDIGLSFDPPVPVSFDRDIRVMLASDLYKQGQCTVTVTLTLPGDTAFLVSDEDLAPFTKTLAGADWFPLACTNELGPSVIGMSDWLDKPAGKHGGVRMVADKFQFADGTPVKFWGTNLAYGGACAPDKKTADFTAARFAKYGVNGVRLHKFSYPTGQMGIGDPQDATKMSADGLDKLDYFASRMKQEGVYFGWSHTFGFHVCPGNRDRLLAYDEIAASLKGNTYAFINFAEDVQDLMIEMVVNLLKHKNPYTDLTYAQEPALSFIELQNEDDIFFYTSEGAFKACPTYRKLFVERFCDWLKAKYGTQEELKKAWGDALKADETLAAKNIVPQCNPWFFGDGSLPNAKDGPRRRLLDTAQHFHELQNKFYGKFVKAIRQAGYQGPLCGSPWQAPSMLPHYYNLRSDWLVGYIDRHNYFGGGLTETMLDKPGSGYFSTGLQQVADRPFGVSEWITVYPSLYSADGVATMAAYGMGLQGWDASYEFQSQAGQRVFNERAGWEPWGVWETDVPTQLGQYPALSRMVLRGDVKESEVISTRRVCPQEMAEGTFNFTDKVSQQGDIKSFTGSVPGEALAAGRVVVEFTDKPQPSTFPDMGKYREGTAIKSATGQLLWDTVGGGWFSVNTPATKAVVGFAQGKSQALDGVTIRLDSPYASVFLTALDKGTTLADTKSALLVAVARNCNSGFKTFAIDDRILDNGKAPILLEPVKAKLSIACRAISAVNILDHDGRRTGKTLPADNGQLTIDTGKDKTFYYEVVFR